MKDAIDRLYATLALVHGLITAQQLREAFALCADGEANSVLQALGQRGWLSEGDRPVLEKHVSTCVAQTADALLGKCGAREVRQQLQADPRFHDVLSNRFEDNNVRGHYRLIEVLGEGGMGRVWLARDEELDRTIALKELKPAIANHAETRARFLREARITGRLEHPVIVPVHELQASNELFYAMRFVRGLRLDQAIGAVHGGTGAWDLRRLLSVFVKVCEALAYAHSNNVVHRDLKPANIVLGQFGEVFVLDWGLAKDLRASDRPPSVDDILTREVPIVSDDNPSESGVTRAGQALGTPAYMSPEQAAGRSSKASPLTDIYGLGAILYHIITGAAPHQHLQSLPMPEMLRRIATEPVPRARTIRALPKALDAICAKAMAFDPGDRYSNALDLAEDVRSWTLDEPVSAYREPWTKRLRRVAAQHRVLTLAVAALAVGLSVALTAFTVAALRDAAALRERTESELVSRAQVLRNDLLTYMSFVVSSSRAEAGSQILRALLSRDTDEKDLSSRRELARGWADYMRQQPSRLAVAALDLKDPDHCYLRIERKTTGDPIEVYLDGDDDKAALRDKSKADAALVQQGRGPRFVSRLRNGKKQIVLVTTTPIEIPGRDAWLIDEYAFNELLRNFFTTFSETEIAIILRDSAGSLLAHSDNLRDVGRFGETLSRDIDPRLQRFLASDDPEPFLKSSAKEFELFRPPFPPLDPEYEVLLSDTYPDKDCIYACKIHFNPHMGGEYVAVIMLAPYAQQLSKTVAGMDFFVVLMVCAAGAILLVALLARKLFPARKPTEDRLTLRSD